MRCTSEVSCEPNLVSDPEVAHFGKSLAEAHANGKVPTALLHKCYRLLRKQNVRPKRRMLVARNLASPVETHAEWCRLVMACGKARPMDSTLFEELQPGQQRQLAQARRAIGHGHFDEDVSLLEVAGRVSRWKVSMAIPRAAWKSSDGLWLEVSWLLVRLALVLVV